MSEQLKQAILVSGADAKLGVGEYSDLPNARFLEKCIGQMAARNRRDKWSSLETALLAEGDSRLMIKYACITGLRWEECEEHIMDSEFLWNYLHDCLRDFPADVFQDRALLTPKRIKEEENQETQRLMIEIMGIETFLSKCQAKVVDTDSHEHNGERALFAATGVNNQWLVVNCPSTGRIYFLNVPRVEEKWNNEKHEWDNIPIDTCEKADRWLCGVAEDDEDDEDDEDEDGNGNNGSGWNQIGRS